MSKENFILSWWKLSRKNLNGVLKKQQNKKERCSINVGRGGEEMMRKYSSSGFKTCKKHVESIGRNMVVWVFDKHLLELVWGCTYRKREWEIKCNQQLSSWHII